MKQNETYQLLAYAHDVNNMDTIKKNTDVLISASREAGLEVHTEKIESICCSLAKTMPSKSGHKDRRQIIYKHVTVQILRNDGKIKI
jgi:hypothetical protein